MVSSSAGRHRSENIVGVAVPQGLRPCGSLEPALALQEFGPELFGVAPRIAEALQEFALVILEAVNLGREPPDLVVGHRAARRRTVSLKAT